jgi:CRP-like cAMP-binding protein/FixJ family two-component response regulator
MSYTILVIEDDRDMSESISSILKLAHYDVLTANNGKMGVELAQQHHPDLILCDITMPYLDGYGVLHVLNRDKEMINTPFVFLTGKADKYEIREGMSLGADDYLTKPFQGHDLLKVVEIRLKKSELLRNSSKSDSDVHTFFNSTKGIRGIRQLAENRPTRTFKKRDFVFMEGQMPTDLYFVVRGKVKTYKINYDGKELITGIHRAEDFIGYVPIMKNMAHYENAEVIEESEISIIPKHEFLELIYSNREIMEKFIALLTSNLIEAESRLLDLAYQSLRQRLARTLLKIYNPIGNGNGAHEKNSSNGNGGTGNGGQIISISRKDISNMIGTATESLNRTLADFKEEGLIDIGGEGIKILNKAKLEHMLH